MHRISITQVYVKKCVSTGSDHHPLNVPEVPQNDPTRMFVPGSSSFVIVWWTLLLYLLCMVCYTGTCQTLHQEHYANVGRKLSATMEKCSASSWQLGRKSRSTMIIISRVIFADEVPQVVSGKMHNNINTAAKESQCINFQKQC